MPQIANLFSPIALLSYLVFQPKSLVRNKSSYSQTVESKLDPIIKLSTSCSVRKKSDSLLPESCDSFLFITETYIFQKQYLTF